MTQRIYPQRLELPKQRQVQVATTDNCINVRCSFPCIFSLFCRNCGFHLAQLYVSVRVQVLFSIFSRQNYENAYFGQLYLTKENE